MNDVDEELPLSKRLDFDDNDRNDDDHDGDDGGDSITPMRCSKLADAESKLDETIEGLNESTHASVRQTTCSSALKGRSTRKIDPSIQRSVRFDRVNVFLFERTQGYNCIPSDNLNKSITIGMSPKHVNKVDFDLDNYNRCKRLFHLDKLEEEKVKIYESFRAALQVADFVDFEQAKQTTKKKKKSATIKLAPIELSDEEIELKINEALESNDPNCLLKEEDRIILDILNNRTYYEDYNNELPLNMELFLPILSPEERRKLLVEAGVESIDDDESKEIVDVRKSRQFCGCKCKSAQSCNQSTCSCYANGIPCQVDKIRFPCACNLKRCKNPSGVKRFNHIAVIKHYQKTLTPKEEEKIDDLEARMAIQLDSDEALEDQENQTTNENNNNNNLVDSSQSSSDVSKKRKFFSETENMEIKNDVAELLSSSSISCSSTASNNDNVVGTFPGSPRSMKKNAVDAKKSKRKSQPKKIQAN